MRAHLHYLSYIIQHKYFVFHAGRRIKVPLWRLIIHDWSKFTRAEWGPYVRRFYGKQDNPLAIQQDFDAAWLHHQHHNPHHWEHWVLMKGKNTYVALPMPIELVREMVADWAGAGRAITGKWEVAEWYRTNRIKMILHPKTDDEISRLIEELFL